MITPEEVRVLARSARDSGQGEVMIVLASLAVLMESDARWADDPVDPEEPEPVTAVGHLATECRRVVRAMIAVQRAFEKGCPDD